MARSFIQLPKTAPIAPQICSIGSVGKILAGVLLDGLLELGDQLLELRGGQLVVELDAGLASSWLRAALRTDRGRVLVLGFRSSTTSPYICTKRR